MLNMTNMTTTYYPTITSFLMHEIPRFGHSNHLADFYSNNESIRQDYIHGLFAFGVFLATLTCTWGIILLYLKFKCGIHRVGCAAGGELIHIDALRKVKVSKAHRKQRIIRSWRIQNVFLAVVLLVPTCAFLFINQGYRPWILSLLDMEKIQDDIETKVSIVMDAIHEINVGIQQLTSIRPMDISAQCPEWNPYQQQQLQVGNNNKLDWKSMQNNLNISILQANHHTNGFAMDAYRTMNEITKTTQSTEHGTTILVQNDWIMKLLLVLLHITTAFFVVGVILTKNNIDYYAYQIIMAYLMIPIFCLVTIATIVMTGIIAVIAMLNADFCTGGPDPGSPIGTLQDIIVAKGFHETSLAFRTLEYYAGDCVTRNPFSSLYLADSAVSNASRIVEAFTTNLTALNASLMDAQCMMGIVNGNNDLRELSGILHSIDENLGKALSQLDCSSGSPIIRRISYGATCTESINSLTWMFFTALAMTVLCLCILTTRAALFNTIVRSTRRRRREKEFEEYKIYHSQYYDTTNWKMDPNGYQLDATMSKLPISSCTGTVESDDTSSVATLTPDYSDDYSPHYQHEHERNKEIVSCNNGLPLDCPLTLSNIDQESRIRHTTTRKSGMKDDWSDSDSLSSDDSSIIVDQSFSSTLSVLMNQFVKVKRNDTSASNNSSILESDPVRSQARGSVLLDPLDESFVSAANVYLSVRKSIMKPIPTLSHVDSRLSNTRSNSYDPELNNDYIWNDDDDHHRNKIIPHHLNSSMSSFTDQFPFHLKDQSMDDSADEIINVDDTNTDGSGNLPRCSRLNTAESYRSFTPQSWRRTCKMQSSNMIGMDRNGKNRSASLEMEPLTPSSDKASAPLTPQKKRRSVARTLDGSTSITMGYQRN